MRENKLRVWDYTRDAYYNFLEVIKDPFLLRQAIDNGEITLCVEWYIGNHDINGKEIYLGDIIHSDLSGLTYIVVFNEDDGCYEGIEVSGKNYCLPYREMKRHAIIGNKHENPELLQSAHDVRD